MANEPWKDYQPPAPESGPWAEYQAPSQPPTQAIPATAAIERPSGLARRVVGDGLVTAGKAAMGLGESLVGLANIPTMGYAGKGLDALGYDPKLVHKTLGDMYSPEAKASLQNIEDAEGFVGTAKAAIQNPLGTTHKALESVPAMIAGGGIARKGLSMLPAGASAAKKALALGAGEGIIAAGSAAEGIRQQTEDGLLTGKQVGAALATGLGTGLIGAAGGRLAQTGIARRLGIVDPDAIVAGMGKAAGDVAAPGIARRFASSAVTEGLLEEMPQSASEQALQNYALDRPIMEGVPEAAGLGTVLGGVMGGGFGAISRPGAQPPIVPPPVQENVQPAADPFAGYTPAADPATTVAQPATPDPLDGSAINADLDARDAKAFDQEAIARGQDRMAENARTTALFEGREVGPKPATLADGSPLPDPAAGPLSKGVNIGAETGAIPTAPYPNAAPGSLADVANKVSPFGYTAPTFGYEAPTFPPTPTDGRTRLAQQAQAQGIDPRIVLALDDAEAGDLDQYDDQLLAAYAKGLWADVQSGRREAPFPQEAARGPAQEIAGPLSEQPGLAAVQGAGDLAAVPSAGQDQAGSGASQADGLPANAGERQSAVPGEPAGAQAEGVNPDAPGATLTNGFKRGEEPGKRYRVSSSNMGVSLEKRNDESGSASAFFIGKDGALIDGDTIARNNASNVDRLWTPPSDEARVEAESILDEMGKLQLSDPKRAALKDRLRDVVTGKGSSRDNPLPESETDRAPVGSWVRGPSIPGVADADTVRQVADVPIDQIDATEFDSAGNIAPEKRADASRYAEAMRNGDQFPNARGSVLPNGKIKLQDGHRRLAAAIENGATTLRVAVNPMPATAGQAPQAASSGQPEAAQVASASLPQSAPSAVGTVESSQPSPQPVATQNAEQVASVPSPQGTPVEGGGQPNNWLGADQAFVKDAPQYGAPTGDSGATAAVQAAPAGTTVLDTVRRPDGSEFNRLLVSAGDGDYDTVIIRDRNKPLADYVSEAKRDANDRAPGRAWAKADRDGMPKDLAAIKAAVAEAGGANTALNDTSKSNSAIAAEVAKKLGIPNDKALESNVYEARQRVIKESEGKADAEARATMKVGDKLGGFQITVDGKRRTFSSATVLENDGGWIKVQATMVGGKKNGVEMSVRPSALRRALDAKKPTPNEKAKAEVRAKKSAGSSKSENANSEAASAPNGKPADPAVESALSAYGYSLKDGEIITPSGKASGVTVTVAKGRARIASKKGDKLWTGSPANVGNFLESFWMAKKPAEAAKVDGFNVAIEDEIRPAGKKRERGFTSEASVTAQLAERGLNPDDYAVKQTKEGGYIGVRKAAAATKAEPADTTDAEVHADFRKRMADLSDRAFTAGDGKESGRISSSSMLWKAGDLDAARADEIVADTEKRVQRLEKKVARDPAPTNSVEPANAIQEAFAGAVSVDHLTGDQLDQVGAILDRAEARRAGREPSDERPATTPEPAHNQAEEAPNAARELDSAGEAAPAGASTDPVPETAGTGDVGVAPADGSESNGGGDRRPRGGRTGPRAGVGDDAGEVPVPSRGKRRKPEPVQERSLFERLVGADDDAGPADAGRARVEPPQVDFTIEADLALGEGGAKTKYQRNVAAIRLLNTLEQEGRVATAEEQRTLALYVGWGGLAQAFDADNKDWTREHAELKGLLTPEEYEAAAQSTQYAHYTSREIIGGMYGAMSRLGFSGGRVLEAGGGVGNFIGLMPDALRTAGRFTLVERERIAAGIAKHLYPRQNVQLADFTLFGKGEDGYFDAVIGNPPFSRTALTDQSGRKHLSGLRIHNYFIAKSIDLLREGGILANVVSNGFMDSRDDRARAYIAGKAKFLGAIRLPNNAFAKNAGTEVTTDIVFFQKLPEKEWGGRAAKQDAARWLNSVPVADPKGGEKINTNAYFAANPHMMLGQWTKAGSMYGPDQPALIARPGQDTAAMLDRAIEHLPSGVWVPSSVARTAAMQSDLTQSLQDDVTVGEGGFYVRGGALWQRMPDRAGERVTRKLTADSPWTEKTKLGEKGVDRLTKAAELRGTLRALLAAEAKNDPVMGGLRATLNTQYDAFVKAHGLLNDSANLRALDDDPDGPLLAALENAYTPGMGAAAAKSAGTKPFKSTAKKAPIFSRRVIEDRPPVTRADSPADALNVSMAERGRIDAAYIGELLGADPEQVLSDMASGDKPLLFKDPASNEYVLRDDYLSGNVRKKLAQAKSAGMLTNAMELEKVIPEDVGAGKISARIGSPWVPASVFQDFATFLLGEGTRANMQFVPLTSSFSGDIQGGSDLAERSTYGTKDYPASKLLMALLNNREVKVTYKDSDGRTHTDKEATEEAKLKANDIRDKFQDWLFSDPERAEGLVRAYNDANNNYVTRQYDGSWLHFPGKVPDAIIKFRKHQRDFVARVLQDRTALADHVVGAGKTFSAIAAAMELKRTGLANKPMIVVPNHLVKQWAADFYRLYPGANILTANKKDFERANRRKFLARIATGDWDAVIIAHSSFGFIKPTAEFETRFNEQQIRLILDTVKQVEDGDGDESQKKRTVKQLQALQERLENRIKSLREKGIDDLLDFAQIGVDQLFIDEAHMFKNLMFSTKMQNIRGLGDAKGSQRAYDMLLKTREVMDRNGRDQGVVFLTGTPVSNSLAEMYHMMRYLMPTAMSEAGFDSFDAWANTYASIEDQLKPKTSGNGYKTVTSFGSFNNTFELLAMFDQVSDTVTMDDIKAAYREENGGKEFPLPALKTGRRQPIAMEKSEAQDAYMEEIGKRAAELEQRRGPPQKGEDNHLTLMSDARKAAMDIRMVDMDITEREKGGRIDRASDEIVTRYRKYEGVRGTQLVFADLGTPLKHAKKDLAEYEALRAEIAKGEDELVQARAALGDEDAIAIVQAADAAQEEMDANGGDWLDGIKMALRGFSIYDDLRAALVEKGIPASQVAFIHDFNTDEQKAGLFRRVNAGEIRVVIGSTAKMGAGTNVQERLVALHHLDIPWRPSDVEQREGRIIRQGNLLAVEGSPIYTPNFEVEILAYVTKDTLDKNMWDIQEKKLRGINQLRTRQIEREIENSFDEMEMSASEMQAAATGNLDLLKEIQLRNDVQKLERKRRSFDAQKSDMVTRKRRAEDRIKTLPAKIARGEALSAFTKTYTQALQAQMAAFKVTINGKTYTDAHAAGQVLRDLVDAKETTEDGKERAAPISVAMNGTTYTARQKLADAFADIRGDADPVRFDVGGKALRRRGDAAKAIMSDLADAVADQKRVEVGKVGPFTVSVEGQPRGKEVEVILTAPNGDEQGNTVLLPMEVTESTLRPVAERVVGMAHTLVLQQPGVVTYQRNELTRAQKDLADVEKAGALGNWPEQEKLDAARAAHKDVLARLKKADEDATKAAADAPPVLESVEELSDADLTPAEKASRDRQTVDKKGLAGKVDRQQGQRDAEVSGVAEGARKLLGAAEVDLVFARSEAGLEGLVTPGYMSQLRDQQKGRKAGMSTVGLYIPANLSATGKPFAVVFTGNKLSANLQLFTAMHEIAGHHGLRMLLGDRLNKVLDLAYQNATVKVVADSIYRSRNMAAKVASGAKTEREMRLLSIEEALADLAAAVRTKNFQRITDKHGVEVPKAMQSRLRAMIDNLVQRIKDLFRRKDVRFSDAQVLNLLENAWQAAQGNQASMSVMGADGALEQVVFHGTPHTVDRFSLQKIGTGEGAQAYGWGMYFASHQGVAESYRTRLTREDDARMAQSAARDEAKYWAKHKGSDEEAIKYLAERESDYTALGDYSRANKFRDAVRWLRDGRPELDTVARRGNTYRVDVPEDSDLLDYDKPMSENPPAVRERAKRVWDAMPEWWQDEVLDRTGAEFEDLTGSEFYQVIGKFADEGGMPGEFAHPDAFDRSVDGKEAAAHALYVAGIPGLRYLDSTSRTKGEGTHNYVIWDESAIGTPSSALESTEGGSLEGVDLSKTKVVGKDGKPLTLYHGSNAQFDAFNVDEERGVFLTNDREAAATYGTPRPMHVLMVNPMEVDAEGRDWQEGFYVDGELTDRDTVMEAARSEGRDGLIIRNTMDYGDVTESGEYPAHDVYIAFRGDQLVNAPEVLESTEDQTQSEQVTSDSILESVEDFTLSDNPTLDEVRIPGEVRLDPIYKAGFKGVLQRLGQKFADVKPHLLATVPLNHLVDFAPKGVPAIGQYIDIQYQMQAFRNKLYTKYDKVAQDLLKFSAEGKGVRGWFGMTVSEQGRNLFSLMHDSTIAGIDPTADGYPDEKVTQFEALKARYNALPEEGQRLYRETRDAYKAQSDLLDQTISNNFRRAMEITQTRAERAHKVKLQEIDESGKPDDEKIKLRKQATSAYKDQVAALEKSTMSRLMALREMLESQRVQQPYFPLKRYGKHWVTVLDKGGTMVGFSKFQTTAEQEAFSKEMQAKGYTAILKFEDGDSQARDMIDPEFAARVEEILQGAEVPDAVRDEVWQAYLERMPDMSMRKSFIHRQNVPGYHFDALKAFGSAQFHGSYQIARLKYGMELQETIDLAKEQTKPLRQTKPKDAIDADKLIGEIEKRHAFVMNPKGGTAAQVVTTAAFLYSLGANPAHLFLNATQTVMLGVPVLGSRYGFKRTAAALGRAVADFTQGKGHLDKANLSADDRKAFNAFMDSGLIDKTQAHDLAGVGETGVEYSAVRQKVMNKIGWFFHQSERLNREVTAMAAYRLARADGKNHETAVAQAINHTYTIHFDYSAASRARFMQGDTAKALLVFRNFQVNMLYRLFRDINDSLRGESPQVKREARKQLGAMMGMYGLFAGTMGMPFYGLAMALAGLGDDDDDPVTAEQQFVNGTVEFLGPTAASVLLRGLPGTAFDIDLTERIGMPNLWFRSPQQEMEGRDSYYYWMEQLLGAGVGPVKGTIDGFNLIMEGQIQRGLERAMPAALRNPMQAIRQAQEGGVTSLDGDLIKETTGGDYIAKALGFQPLSVSEQYDKNSNLKNADRRLSNRREKLLNQYFLAMQMGDDTAEVLADVQAFNLKNPEYAITRDTFKRSARLRNRNKLMSENGIVMTRRMRRLQERTQDDTTE